MDTTSAAVSGFTAIGVALFAEFAVITSEIKAMAFKIPPKLMVAWYTHRRQRQFRFPGFNPEELKDSGPTLNIAFFEPAPRRRSGSKAIPPAPEK